jgi:hypothetical protein
MAEQTKKCPFCAEEILSEAIKCKHCGEMLVKKEVPSPKQSAGIWTGLGLIILAAGLVVGFYYWQYFKASVEAPGVGRVNNIGLLQDKQTGTLLGFGAAALGLVLLLVGLSKVSDSKTADREAPAVQAPIVHEARPFEGEIRKLIISCPECKQSEEITSDKLYDVAQYRNFSADVTSSFASCKITLKCKNCGKQFKYNKLEVSDNSLGR